MLSSKAQAAAGAVAADEAARVVAQDVERPLELRPQRAQARRREGQTRAAEVAEPAVWASIYRNQSHVR